MSNASPPDVTVNCSCGCVIVFFAKGFYLSSRMTACEKHNKRDQTDIRSQIIQLAKQKVRETVRAN